MNGKLYGTFELLFFPKEKKKKIECLSRLSKKNDTQIQVILVSYKSLVFCELVKLVTRSHSFHKKL